MMKRLIAPLTLALAFAGTIALAHSGVKNMTVMKRMEGMKSIGQSTKILGQMAKGELAFDAEVARAAAAEIARHAAETPALFEAREEDPKDEAKPIIWEDFADFTAKAQDLEMVAKSLSETLSTEEELRAGLGRIGGTCKACHEIYRE